LPDRNVDPLPAPLESEDRPDGAPALQPDAVFAARLSFDPRSPRIVAVSLSALAHAALAFASGVIDFGPEERQQPRTLAVVVLDASVLLPESPPRPELPPQPELPPRPESRSPESPPLPESLSPESPPQPESLPHESSAAQNESRASDAPPAEAAREPAEPAEAVEPPSLLDDTEHTRRQRARLQRADLEIVTALEMARARDEILHKPRPRTFSLADLVPETPPEEPRPSKSVFDSPSVGRAGLEERTALGQTVRWVSDECFQTVGMGNMFGFPAGADIYDMPMTNCVRTKPRSDLFEHLKRDHDARTLPAAPQ